MFLPFHTGQHNELQAACLAVPKKNPHDPILKKQKQNEGGTVLGATCDKTFESLSSPSADSERTHSSSRSSTLETRGLHWPMPRPQRNVHPQRSKAALYQERMVLELNYTATDNMPECPTPHECSNWLAGRQCRESSNRCGCGTSFQLNHQGNQGNLKKCLQSQTRQSFSGSGEGLEV